MEADSDDFEQVPGLYRLWDLQLVINRTDDYQVHYAEQTEACMPLFAVYRRIVDESVSAGADIGQGTQ